MNRRLSVDAWLDLSIRMFTEEAGAVSRIHALWLCITHALITEHSVQTGGDCEPNTRPVEDRSMLYGAGLLMLYCRFTRHKEELNTVLSLL